MDASTRDCGAVPRDTAGPDAAGFDAAGLGTAECGAAWLGGADVGAGTAPGGRGAHEFAVRRIREYEAAMRAALAEQLRWIAEVAEQGSYAADGARSMRSWLREVLNLAEGEAATRVRVAGAIQPRTAMSGAPLETVCPATGEAVRAGEVSLEHARVILDGVEKLPPSATDTERETAERTLAEQARTFSPRQLRTLAERIRYLLDQDGVLREEEQQYAARELRLGTGRDGMTLIRGRLDRVAGAQLSAVLESLAAPQPVVDGKKDPRSAGQRNADALTQAIEVVLASDRLPRAGGIRPRVTITIDYQRLRTELRQHHPATTRHDQAAASDDHAGRRDCRTVPSGSQSATPDTHTTTTTNRLGAFGRTGSLPGLGVLDNTGQPVTAATVRRLACDAEIVPVVLGGESQPLDIGRQRRTAPPHLRAALLARDGPCSFPGCDQPPGTSEAHHLVHWVDGGNTSLNNMTMLCGHHHRTVHRHGWDISIRGGRPVFIPPAWIEPTRTPRSGGTASGIPPPEQAATCFEPGWPGAA